MIKYVAELNLELDKKADKINNLEEQLKKQKEIINKLREYMLDIDYKMGWQYVKYLDELLKDKEV